MHQRLSAGDLQAALARPDAGGGNDDEIKMNAFAARANEFFRAKERKEQRERNLVR
jgi:hypothetical protein